MLIMFFIFAINVQPVDAATYAQGQIKLEEWSLYQTQSFNLPKGKVSLTLDSLTYTKTQKTARFDVRLFTSNRNYVGSCQITTSDKGSKNTCNFSANGGKHFLEFSNRSDTPIRISYRVYN